MLQVLIAIIVMIQFSTNLPSIEPRYQFVDLFAGACNSTKVWFLDCLRLHDEAMCVVWFETQGVLVSLESQVSGWICLCNHWQNIVCRTWDGFHKCSRIFADKQQVWNAILMCVGKSCQTNPLPRLVLHTMLCLCPEAVVLMGPCCASWGLPARGTSKRSYINAHGAMRLPFVGAANVTVGRKHVLIALGVFLAHTHAILI